MTRWELDAVDLSCECGENFSDGGNNLTRRQASARARRHFEQTGHRRYQGSIMVFLTFDP